ncbi:MAG TPA: homoserine kinase [Chthoniobacterales bacterium]|nr:homoserine kinase [Chthoniobacterales bacterium]
MQQVTVRVPASTSNLGPGFDCLGVALRIYKDVTVTPGSTLPLPTIASDAAKLFWQRARCRSLPFSVSMAGDIPRARGLGSSAAVRTGILFGLNQLCGSPLDQLSIFRLCAQIEGHPDNAAPAVFGGFNVIRASVVQHFPVSPRLKFVLLIPEVELKTSTARKILPARVTRGAAVENCANACAITAAFVSRQYEQLRGAFVDKLHQPFRAKLLTFLPRVIAAAEKAGALGAFLSGSGSTICAVTLADAERIAAAMQRKISPPQNGFAVANNYAARVVITEADNRGARVRSIRNPPSASRTL